MENYNFLKQKIKIAKDIRSINQKKLSLNGVLKPLNIGSLSFIIECDPKLLKQKILLQLKRLQNLQQSISEQITNPKYEKVRQKNNIDFKVLKDCVIIHRKYFNYILYSKLKNKCNIVLLQRVTNNYKQQLFELNQHYLKLKLEMQNIDTTKSSQNNEI